MTGNKQDGLAGKKRGGRRITNKTAKKEKKGEKGGPPGIREKDLRQAANKKEGKNHEKK